MKHCQIPIIYTQWITWHQLWHNTNIFSLQFFIEIWLKHMSNKFQRMKADHIFKLFQCYKLTVYIIWFNQNIVFYTLIIIVIPRSRGFLIHCWILFSYIINFVVYPFKISVTTESVLSRLSNVSFLCLAYKIYNKNSFTKKHLKTSLKLSISFTYL